MNKEIVSQIDVFLEKNRQNLVNDIIDIININSVKSEPDGKYIFGTGAGKVLEVTLEKAKQYGFDTKNYDYYCGIAQHGNTEKQFGIIAHLDTVPAGNDWLNSPFHAVEKDGFIIGRGANDDKGPAIAGLYVMRCIKELGINLNHGIKLILGCDEESGMSDIEHFLKCDKAPVFSFTPDTDFPVCNGEKGIMSLNMVFEKGKGNLISIGGGVASNMVADRCTAVLSNVTLALISSKITHSDFTIEQEGENVKITAKGISSHAAHPNNSVNAISKLSKILLEHHLVTGNHKIILQHLVAILSDYNGVSLNIAFSDKPSGKLTHIGGMIRETSDKISLNLNIRYPVTIKCKQITDALEKTSQRYNCAIEELNDSPPSYTPADSEVIKLLSETFNTVSKKQMQPYVMGGGTYARHIPNTVAFGPNFSDRKPLFDDCSRGSCHQPDECQNIDDLIMAIKIYVLSILKIDKLDFSNADEIKI